MRFMLIFHMPEASWVSKDLVREIVSWKRHWGEKGVWEQGCPLQPVGMTHTIRLQPNGEVEVQDAPLRDDDPVFYAFEILTCESLEMALDVASTHPALAFEDSALEVREIWDQLDPDIMGDEYDAITPDFHAKRRRLDPS